MALFEQTLVNLRGFTRQLADMVNTTFVSDAEIDFWLNMGVQELYDLFLEVHGEEYFLKTVEIQVTSPTNVYALPDDLHAVKGVDYSETSFPLQAESASPSIGETSWDVIHEDVGDRTVPLVPYTFMDRHQGGTYSRFLGEPPMGYRIFSERLGTWSAGGDDPDGYSHTYRNMIRLQPVRDGYILVWYVPEPPKLAEGADEFDSVTYDRVSTAFFNGYEMYPVIYAAKRCLDKEETDSTHLARDLAQMQARVRRMASARDVGHPEAVQDVEAVHEKEWW